MTSLALGWWPKFSAQLACALGQLLQMGHGEGQTTVIAGGLVKAGALNALAALARSSACKPIMSSGSAILNLYCDQYIYESRAVREGRCFMLENGGDHNC